MRHLFVSAMLFLSAFSFANSIEFENTNPPSPLLTSHIGLLNELSENRRVNRFYFNEQPVQQGLQVGYVNTHSGNVTFAKRDLVTVGRMPVVMARVYDSRLVDGADFGQGWQLSLAETIELMADGSLAYRDDTATLNTFLPAAVGYKIDPAQNSDIKSVAFNASGQLQISYLNQWVKRFEKLGDIYRLVSITDNNTNQLKLTYAENKLSKISGSGNRFVTIERDRLGRIIRLEDDVKRTVGYQYNHKGQIDSVRDLGANVWAYQYHGNGLLHKVTDPAGKVAAQFGFGSQGKAKRVEVRSQLHSFLYKDNQTRVKDASGNTTVFVHNEQGFINSITNAEGVTSRVELNNRNQISQLWQNRNSSECPQLVFL